MSTARKEGEALRLALAIKELRDQITELDEQLAGLRREVEALIERMRREVR